MADGVEAGELSDVDPGSPGVRWCMRRRVSTIRAHVEEWSDPAVAADLAAVWALLVAGLLAR